jgi:hypothetical protein
MLALRASMDAQRSVRRLDKFFGRDPVPATSRSWYTGILGERAVAEQLRALPQGWLVLHSVPVGDKGSDIDHVLVSPTGRVLTINTKNSPGGRVWVSPKAILVNGQRYPYLRNSQHEAARAAKVITAATGGLVDTLAVIVVVGASLTHRGQPDNVAVVTLPQLVRFLTSRLAPSRSNVSAETIRHVVSQPGTWTNVVAPTETSTDHLLWFLDLLQHVHVAHRRRVRWALATVVMCIAAPVALGAQVLSHF